MLRILGVDIRSAANSIRTRINRWLTNTYALICLIYEVIVTIYARFISNYLILFNGWTSLYDTITNVIFTLGYVGSHLIFLIFIAAVMQSFRLVKNHLNVDRMIFIKVRRFATACVSTNPCQSEVYRAVFGPSY